MKTVLVTGASRGIGAAIACLFGTRGWHVVLTYARRRAAAETQARAIAEAGGKASVFALDLREGQPSVARLFGAMEAASVRLHAVVNNAAVTGTRTRLDAADPAANEEICRINLVGAMLVARAAIPLLSTRNHGPGGSIVNLSSTATRRGSPGQWVHYAATKGAIDVFTRGLAAEVANEGIRVNAVAPGLTLSAPEEAESVAQRLAELRHEIPMGRAIEAREVAEAVWWLCSEAASAVTGVVLPASGGR
jgi:NAD(P)-dependent dehydrogenase (short-subunit alcohol dehydrogenase family)